MRRLPFPFLKRDGLHTEHNGGCLILLTVVPYCQSQVQRSAVVESADTVTRAPESY